MISTAQIALDFYYEWKMGMHRDEVRDNPLAHFYVLSRQYDATTMTTKYIFQDTSKLVFEPDKPVRVEL